MEEGEVEWGSEESGDNLVKDGKKLARNRWRISEWSLNHSPQEDFTRCFWQKSEKVQVWWLAYRGNAAIYFLTTWFIAYFNVGREIRNRNFWIFLTNWIYLLETMYFFLAFIIVFIQYIKEKKKIHKKSDDTMVLPWHYKLCWIFQNIALTGSVIVTTLFWFMVYESSKDPLDVISISTHAINSIFMVTDFALVAQPHRTLHFYCPALIGSFYMVFSLVYQLGTEISQKIPIYKTLDWYNNPIEAGVFSLLTFVFLIMIHVCFWGLYKVKIRIKIKIKK